jgi:hypothetical protein
MPEQRKVQCCASVDRPYASVRDALHRLPLASSAAAPVHIHSICDRENIAGLPSVTRLTLMWEHADASAPLPVTSAEIYASALSAAETHLEIEGHVPAAPGLRSDAEGDRVAGVCIHALLEEVIERLRHDIDPTTDGCAATFTRNGALGAA